MKYHLELITKEKKKEWGKKKKELLKKTMEKKSRVK